MPDHEYLPNSWVIIKVTKDEGVHYRVLAGFEEKPRLYSDDWRISKDITSVAVSYTHLTLPTSDLV